VSSPVLATLGKYQLVRKLATGGMAEVFLAKTAGPGGFEKTLVLKRILSHLVSDPVFIGMFLSEAKLAAQLTHPNVVSIFDFGQEGDTWFLVMEYIDGPNLRSLYKRAFELGQPPPFNLAAKIISQACEGLAYAHEFSDPETGEPLELVHRDISPDNILLGRNGGVKVVDFGIAKAASQTHQTRPGTIKGKFAYMAPEQLRGQDLDRRADVFALGIVLHELISGTKPFDCTTDATIMQAILFEPFRPAIHDRPDTPPELQKIIDRALAKDRAERYADCRQMQADLDQFIVSQGLSVGQHQLAQLVARLANPNAPAMATPSPRPSAPNLPRASVPNPRPSLSAQTKVKPLGRQDVRTAVTEPAMPTPAPMRAPTVSLRAATSQDTMPIPSLASYEAQLSPPVKKRPVALIAGAVGLAVLAAVGTYSWSAYRTPPLPPPQAEPKPVEVPAVVEVPDPTPPAPDPAPIAEVAAPTPTPTPAPKPAPVAASVKPTQKPSRPVKRPEAPAAKAPEPSKAEMGLVDFRVRPYASVFVDGTFYGVTPFPKVKLSPGVHKVKLVNKDIGKEISLQFEVQAGENTLKYNLETE
jgi:eukaryotic-like serine/threonine-protein kinase